MFLTMSFDIHVVLLTPLSAYFQSMNLIVASYTVISCRCLNLMMMTSVHWLKVLKTRLSITPAVVVFNMVAEQ